MRIRIIFARVIVPVLADRFVRSHALQEIVVIFQESWFVIIDINACGDVHRVHQAQAFFHPALFHRRFDLWRDVDVCASSPGFECQLFTIGVHSCRYRVEI